MTADNPGMPHNLEEIFQDDTWGVLNSEPENPSENPDERKSDRFEEINRFIQTHGREPSPKGDFSEQQLAHRLLGFRNSVDVADLLPFDRFNLLNAVGTAPVQISEADNSGKTPESIDDILHDENFGRLLDDDPDIFTLLHVPKTAQRPEYIGTHKKCREFDKFEPLFIDCQKDLKSGKRTISDFRGEFFIEPGMFFIVRGLLTYIAEKQAPKRARDGRYQARLRCIYANGTESDVLDRSLAKAMYAGEGKRISPNMDTALLPLHGVTDADNPTGVVYILESKSKDVSIKQYKNLYKIGFSETNVEQRIANAENEPTYLMASVRVLEAFQTYNMNTQKFEKLLHRFFENCRVAIDVRDNQGMKHTVREWFQVPLADIIEAIRLTIEGSIVNYAYDRIEGIVPR